jgi:phosphatidylserine decarboxylase
MPDTAIPNKVRLSPKPIQYADPIQMGYWTPSRTWATANYLVPLRRDMAARRAAGTLAALIPEMVTFKAWVSDNGIYRMWVTRMIDQANSFIADKVIMGDLEDISEILEDGDSVWIDGYDEFFELLNEIITTSPSFNTTAMVGTPMNAMMAVGMATESGLALFHDATFNQQFKNVLNAWNGFLKSPNSLDKLDISEPEKEGSWISTAAHEAGVWDQMVHDPNLPGYGFDSWNSFFIRQFVPGARPFQGDANTVVNIGCETTPWKYEAAASFEAKFWIKSMPYSLLDLFGGQAQWAEQFVGGQAYQGFLSATHYHRWQAPLDGKLVRSWVQPGTYFAQRPGQGENEGTWEGTASQPYLGQVATRAVFIFEKEGFGYVAFICIGMVEVSTCYIEPAYIVAEGAAPVAVTRGDGIGNFEFGGSTHMMIFQKDRAKLEEWAVDAVDGQNNPTPTPLGSIIATAV